MLSKKENRVRRGKKTSARIATKKAMRLIVQKSPRHIYAQVVAPEGGKILASASTLDKDFKSLELFTGNVEAAKRIGQLVAERAKKAGVEKVAFDRSGFKYHGRIKALADAARESGLDF